jgi:Zn-dependent metalloprotease
MNCQIIPNKLLIKLAEREAKTAEEKREFLRNINFSTSARYKRSIILNNRNLFLDALPVVRSKAMEKLWYYDCNSSWEMPRDPVHRIEELHSKDKPEGPAQAAEYYNLDETYDYFRDVHKRRSFDKRSATVRYYANFGEEYNNAFWDGEQLVFGAGDGEYFNNFAGFIDVVAHEFTHAVTQYSADLIYHGQPGALNETISDVFGIIVKQRILGQKDPASASWLIGEGVFNTKTLGQDYRALRDMAEPGTAYPGDDQPKHMNKYVETNDDNAGVHINSGITNRAFYLMAVAFGGTEEAAKIWYTALEDQRAVKADSDFEDFAKATLRIGKRLYHEIGYSNVFEAWSGVGIL